MSAYVNGLSGNGKKSTEEHCYLDDGRGLSDVSRPQKSQL